MAWCGHLTMTTTMIRRQQLERGAWSLRALFVEKEAILLTRIIDANRRCLWCGCTRSETPQFRCGPRLCGHIAALCNRCHLQWQRDVKRTEKAAAAVSCRRITQREAEEQRRALKDAREGRSASTRNGPWSAVEVQRFDAAFTRLADCPWQTLTVDNFKSYAEENAGAISLPPLPSASPADALHVKHKREALNPVYTRAFLEDPAFVRMSLRRPVLGWMATQIGTRTFVQVKSRLQKQFTRVRNALGGKRMGRPRKGKDKEGRQNVCSKCRGIVGRDTEQKCDRLAAATTTVENAEVHREHAVGALVAVESHSISQAGSKDASSVLVKKRKRKKSTAADPPLSRHAVRAKKRRVLVASNGCETLTPSNSEQAALSHEPQWKFEMPASTNSRRKNRRKASDGDLPLPQRKKGSTQSATASDADAMEALIADLVGSLSTSDGSPVEMASSSGDALPTDLPSDDFAMSLEGELDTFCASGAGGLLPPLPMLAHEDSPLPDQAPMDPSASGIPSVSLEPMRFDDLPSLSQSPSTSDCESSDAASLTAAADLEQRSATRSNAASSPPAVAEASAVVAEAQPAGARRDFSSLSLRDAFARVRRSQTAKSPWHVEYPLPRKFAAKSAAGGGGEASAKKAAKAPPLSCHQTTSLEQFGKPSMTLPAKREQ